jgi:hypothetical protein
MEKPMKAKYKILPLFASVRSLAVVFILSVPCLSFAGPRDRDGGNSSGIELSLTTERIETAPDKKNRVVINGVVSGTGQIIGMRWDWGDGTTDENQMFPASHLYSGDIERAVVKVTARDENGHEKTVPQKIRFKEERVTLKGAHVVLKDFPESFFDGSDVPPGRVVSLLDTIYLILEDAHHRSRMPELITYIYIDRDGGAFSDSRKKTIGLLRGGRPSGFHHWDVYIHEMSHNMAGQNPHFLGLMESGFSPFLDEHQAEIMPEYVFHEIAGRGGLSPSELEEFKKASSVNRKIQRDAFERHRAENTGFCVRGDIARATLSGQALSWEIIRKLDKDGNYGAVKKFMLYLKDPALNAAGFGVAGKSGGLRVPSDSELLDYVLNAHSAAFDDPGFKNSLAESLMRPGVSGAAPAK